eukprot:PITA_30331
MEHLLQKVSGARVMSFLDGFSGYNQVVVHPEDQEKISFTTSWGTFMYFKILFGMMNDGATFQRAMDIAFVGEKDKFVLIYLDDITVFSNNHKDHLQHLNKVFLKCRQFGIYVNPKKSQLSLEEGKLMGHIVSVEGVEHPVAFFSKTLREVELRYDLIEKQAYALIKSLMAFRIYIVNSKAIVYVPSASVNDVLTQPNIDGKRAKWIVKFIALNIEVKPTKLVKDQGLAKLMAEENCSLLNISCIGSNSSGERTEEATKEHEKNQSLAENLATCEWYSSVVHFLQKLEVPLGNGSSQGRAIKLISAKFFINKNMLYWKDPLGILLRCLDKGQSVEVMHQFYSSICGGNNYWKTTTHKTLRRGYCWPTMFSDVFSFVDSCDKCQRFAGRQQLKSLPLKPVHSNGPFQ